ncbi:MAG: hypothetical protein IKS45_04605, partial [Thermoguttaceae bacterium]|nr:hypothetical protein [Thermoguttaceae bacterium]
MSQPLNDDFNNNNQNSDSNIQYANNNEGAYQSTSHDNSLEAESVNEQSSNAQQQPEDEEERPEDKEQSDAGGDVVNPAEKQPEGVSEEAPSNADNSDNDDKDKESVTEPDVPDNPLDDLPKETASNADNNNNHASANAPEPSSADVSKDNNENFSEIIQKKIDAVKDFAFCQKKVSFPFCQKKYKDIPVYPYVAALTGHRDAVITDAVKDTAKKQLRSLAQAWDNACKGRSWLIIPKKTAPLIVLIGLGDGESGKLWAEIAADLRDSEKCNIKIIAVAGMPLKDMVNILSKHTSFLSDKKDFLDAKKSFDYILEKAEGLIELPYNQDVKEYIKLYENLEMNCTGDNAAHSDDIFKILFKESKAFQDIQYKEYRKFMCIHSHVLLALTENATSWESANLAGIDINELNNDSSDNAISKDSLLIPFKEKDDARKALKELNSQITELKNRGCKPQKFEELISSFETLAGSLFKKFTEPIPRTNAMIFYKLLGNVDSALVPDNRKINGISFTSIGPVVCIHTKHKTPDTETENPQNSTADVTILVKDQPNDVSADLIMKFKWNNKDISQFNEIKDVITQCGAINKRLFNKSYFSDFPEKDVVKEFQETQSNNKQQHNVEQASIDESALSLVKHHNSSKKLSQHYYWWMKFWTRTFAIFAVLIFSLFGIGSVTGSKSIIFYSNCGIGALFAALGIYSWFNIHRYYHYFEALANGLKVQIYWNLAEVNEDVPGQFYL